MLWGVCAVPCCSTWYTLGVFDRHNGRVVQGLQAESTPRPAAAEAAAPGPAGKGSGAPAAAERRPSAFARLCSCGGAPATAGDGEPATAAPADQSRPSSSGQSLASNSSPSQSGGGRVSHC